MLADADLADFLRSSLDGRVLPASPEQTTDFGGAVRRVPGLVVRAASERDVVTTLKAARERGVSVVTRGAGHSVRGQTLTDGGIQLVNLSDALDARLLPDGRVEVAARSKWRDLETFLRRSGRASPVLTDYLDLSIGGTLSVGGYGQRSVRCLAQVDQIDRLRLVTPAGDAVWCSPVENADLFRFSLAGLGQVGVIERVVLRTVPAKPLTRMHVSFHRDTDALCDAADWLARCDDARVDTFFAAVQGAHSTNPGMVHSQVGVELDRRDQTAVLPDEIAGRRFQARDDLVDHHAYLHGRVSQWVRDYARHRHLWADHLVDVDGLRAMLRWLDERRLSDPAHANWLEATYILAVGGPGLRGRTRLPFEATAFGGPTIKFGVGLYFMVPEGDAAALAETRRALRDALAECVRLGGRPYLYGWADLDAASRRALYGPELAELARLRAELDPDGLFNPHGWSELPRETA